MKLVNTQLTHAAVLLYLLCEWPHVLLIHERERETV